MRQHFLLYKIKHLVHSTQNTLCNTNSRVCFYRVMRQGMHDLKVWADVEADGNSATTTPGKTTGQADEMSRISKVLHNAIVFAN